MLFIEYVVNQDGEIEVVALINVVEEDGQDPEGEAWMADDGHDSQRYAVGASCHGHAEWSKRKPAAQKQNAGA